MFSKRKKEIERERERERERDILLFYNFISKSDMKMLIVSSRKNQFYHSHLYSSRLQFPVLFSVHVYVYTNTKYKYQIKYINYIY